jgi:hypothetical protein
MFTLFLCGPPLTVFGLPTLSRWYKFAGTIPVKFLLCMRCVQVVPVNYLLRNSSSVPCAKNIFPCAIVILISNVYL